MTETRIGVTNVSMVTSIFAPKMPGNQPDIAPANDKHNRDCCSSHALLCGSLLRQVTTKWPPQLQCRDTRRTFMLQLERLIYAVVLLLLATACTSPKSSVDDAPYRE